MSGKRSSNNRAHSKVLKAWEYICTYHRIWSKQQDKQQDERPSTDVDTATPIKVEKLMKLFKMHRCTLDFDHAQLL